MKHALTDLVAGMGNGQTIFGTIEFHPSEWGLRHAAESPELDAVFGSVVDAHRLGGHLHIVPPQGVWPIQVVDRDDVSVARLDVIALTSGGVGDDFHASGGATMRSPDMLAVLVAEVVW